MASPSPAPSTSSSAYDTTHRAFLHSFLSHSTHTLTTARPILASILTIASSSDEHPRTTLPNDITEADFISYINTLNAALTPYDFEIRSTIPQTGVQGHGAGNGNRNGSGSSKERVYALINTTSDPQTQLATTFTADEIAFVKRVLDAMFETYNAPTGALNGKEVCAITDMQATQLSRVTGSRRSVGGSTQTQAATNGDEDDDDAGGGGTQMQGGTAQSLSLMQAETVLKTLVATGWLTRPSEIPGAKSYYVLSPRALLELKNWLLETYNEPPITGEDGEEEEEAVERVKTCRGCSDVVLSGQRCADKRCGVRMHDFCVAAVMRAGAGRSGHVEQKCPECGRSWTGRDFVGVRAVKDIGEKWLNHQGGQRVNGQRNGRNREEEEEVEEQEDED